MKSATYGETCKLAADKDKYIIPKIVLDTKRLPQHSSFYCLANHFIQLFEIPEEVGDFIYYLASLAV
jgi:hypothetical protein